MNHGEWEAARWAGSGGEVPKNIETVARGGFTQKLGWRDPNSPLSGEPVVLQVKLSAKGMAGEEFQRTAKQFDRYEQLVKEGKLSKPDALDDIINHAIDVRSKPEDVASVAVVTEPFEDQGSWSYWHKGVPVTESPHFKKWFGNSKVVDKDGKPLRAFHGTSKDFFAFNTEAARGKKNKNPNWVGVLAHGSQRHHCMAGITIPRMPSGRQQVMLKTQRAII